MRPIELQSVVVQAPNAGRTVQQQVTGPQVAQQTFAQELQRTASQRAAQVQPADPAAGSQPVAITPDEHGEQRKRRPGARKALVPVKDGEASVAPVEPGLSGSRSKIDVVA